MRADWRLQGSVGNNGYLREVGRTRSTKGSGTSQTLGRMRRGFTFRTALLHIISVRLMVLVCQACVPWTGIWVPCSKLPRAGAEMDAALVRRAQFEQ